MDEYVITRLCAGTCDTACVDVCPVDCIAGPLPIDEMRGHPTLQLYIDPEECIYCGACEPACPVDAIFPLAEVPAQYEEDIEKNRAFFAARR